MLQNLEKDTRSGFYLTAGILCMAGAEILPVARKS